MSEPIAQETTQEIQDIKSIVRTRIRRRYFHMAIILIAITLGGGFFLLPRKQMSSNAQSPKEDETMSQKRPAKVRAPEFAGGRSWLNTNHPLKMSELRGKVVLLDFWTYCCINCMHIIPDLKKLEANFPKELVVIGVHSAKFKNEKESDNIRQAVLRYEVEHPVVNDSDFEIWQSFAVHAWPTLILIDPDGYVVDQFPGEGNYEELYNAIKQLTIDFRAKGKLNEKPLNLILEKEAVAEQPLSYPGKVVTDAAGQRLFISDSNHNRIVISNLTGELIDVIGNGQIGQDDGDYQSARFFRPQGMALSPDGNLLYVADTENHLIRLIDLKNKKVDTIAGTGQQSRQFNEFGEARKIALNSPWDVKLVQHYLFIAMAGPHQIWIMDINDKKVGPFAGSGREGRIDGPRHTAALAQPSGLAFNGKMLFVADSEISTIRAVELRDEGEVYSVVGSGDLFGFGDVDGESGSVRLQHPLGVEYTNGLLYVADTYNHKIKVVDLKEAKCTTLFGSGKPGNDDGKSAKFYEPSGLSLLGDKLYIADTNNHQIRVADLNTKEVTTLKIKNLTAPALVKRNLLPNREDIKLTAQKLATGKAELILDLKLPQGYHLNEESTQTYSIKTADRGIKIDDASGALKNPTLPIKIPVQIEPGTAKATVEVALTFYYCPIGDGGACKIKSLVWNVPIEFDPASKENALKLHYEVKE